MVESQVLGGGGDVRGGTGSGCTADRGEDEGEVLGVGDVQEAGLPVPERLGGLNEGLEVVGAGRETG